MKHEILSAELVDVFSGERTPKFIATLDADGIPNVVPVISLRAADGKTIIFGEFMIVKTRQNLEKVPEVGVAIFTEDLKIWTIRGRFLRFERSGSYVDTINTTANFRYNAYSGIRNAGVIEALEVTHTWSLTKQDIVRQMLFVKMFQPVFRFQQNGGVVLPHTVREKFDRLQAVKFIAYRDEQGYPSCLPVPSLSSAGKGKMIFNTVLAPKDIEKIPHSSWIAASVITLDPVAYQVKGTFEGVKSLGVGSIGSLSVREAYSASPPLPGHRIV